MRNSVLVLMIVVLSSAWGSVVGCHVEPVKAAWSGRTLYENVIQTVTCNFDSLSYVELFAGAKGSGGVYHVAVYDGNALLMASYGNRVTDHGWVKFQNWGARVAFTKGKQYRFRFTLAGSDSAA